MKRKGTVISVVLAATIFLTIPFRVLGEVDSVDSRKRSALPSLELGSYTLQSGPIKIGTDLRNISGLTYNPLSKTLFLVNNRPAKIIEVDFVGTVKREIDLLGFKDTEGIAHVRENIFAVLEEKRCTICIIDITPDTTEIDRADSRVIILVDSVSAANKGPEGLSYDQKGGNFYVVKEKSPRRLYQLPWPITPEKALQVSYPRNIQKNSLSLKDFSGIHYSSENKKLLILSDDSAAVVETTMEGKELSRLSLQKGAASGLQKDIPQAEGITMDGDGTLFICSEPNLLYEFSK